MDTTQPRPGQRIRMGEALMTLPAR